jgi:hypothetical protein
MVKNEQLALLRKYRSLGYSIEVCAARAGMSVRTARKYLRGDRMFGVDGFRKWRTRQDPFEGHWKEIEALLDLDTSLEAKTIFDWLQRQYSGEFEDGQLRSLQRRVKQWRAEHGPEKEVFFDQIHYPGEICASDFCNGNRLEITINRIPFDHLLYHLVATYSNWEYVRICYSETFEALSEGLSSGLRALGGTPRFHRTDRLGCAINNSSNKGASLARYEGLLDYYSIKALPTNPVSPNENGDVESAHNHFLRCVQQELILRGSHDFNSREDYERFLAALVERRNLNRATKVREEHEKLKPLPVKDYDAPATLQVRVTRGSTVNIRSNTYSVPSRLIGFELKAKLYEHYIELWYGDKMLERLERLRGKQQVSINYRHIIHWLIRKPGAFKDYKYHAQLFPTNTFRMAYDWLLEHCSQTSTKVYLRILELAATVSEVRVEAALDRAFEEDGQISADIIERYLIDSPITPFKSRGTVAEVDLLQYDSLLFSGSQTLQ